MLETGQNKVRRFKLKKKSYVYQVTTTREPNSQMIFLVPSPSSQETAFTSK